MEPRLIEMELGGWLAVTEPGASTPLGVFGQTPDEARQRFDEAVRIREELHAGYAENAAPRREAEGGARTH